MSVADVKHRAAFVARFKPHDRVHTGQYGFGTIRAIAGNFAYVACDEDGPFGDDRSIAGCRIILFENIEQEATARDRFADMVIADLEARA